MPQHNKSVLPLSQCNKMPVLSGEKENAREDNVVIEKRNFKHILLRSPTGLLHTYGPLNVPTRIACVVAGVCGEAHPTNFTNVRPTSHRLDKNEEKELCIPWQRCAPCVCLLPVGFTLQLRTVPSKRILVLERNKGASGCGHRRSPKPKRSVPLPLFVHLVRTTCLAHSCAFMLSSTVVNKNFAQKRTKL